MYIRCVKYNASPSIPLISSKVSLYLRFGVECGIENTENLWNCEVLKAIDHLTMEPWMVAEVKKGLDFGRQVGLPPNLTFSPLLIAKLFASEGRVRPFQHLRWVWCLWCS